MVSIPALFTRTSIGPSSQLGGCVMRPARQNLAGLNRADHHDVALALLRHGAPAVDLRTQPAAAKVDVGEPGPLLVGEVEERDDGFDTGVVYQNVDRPELRAWWVRNASGPAEPCRPESSRSSRCCPCAAPPRRAGSRPANTASRCEG